MKISLSIVFLLIGQLLSAQAIPVTVEKKGEQWQMLRDGKPYYVKGVGGHVHMDKAAEIGANSIRLWGAENAKEVLDEAEKEGLTVMLGLWVQHERHGFDYDDPVAIKKQLEGFRQVVMEFKDHPALLLWGVGNEVDLFYNNTSVWDAIQDIAAMIHELDPNHPTSTVTAGLDRKEVELVMEKAPDIDIYCVNTYGDIAGVPENIRPFGWKGPYMITEWGVNGHWESPTTDFGMPIEQTSHEKALSFDKRYSFIENDANYCIGSYAFLWGQKQETTSTWYGLFTPDGASTEAIDVLQRRWGSEPKNCAPQLSALTIDGKKANENIYLTAGEKVTTNVMVKDSDGDKLRYVWSVVPESTDKKSGGDKEAAPPAVLGAIANKNAAVSTLRAPKEEGPYRLFVWVYDRKGQVGTANVPFYSMPRSVEAGPARGIAFKKRELDIPNRN